MNRTLCTDDECWEYADTAYSAVLKYLENLKDDYQWYFKVAYLDKEDETLTVFFTSYELHEYNNFSLVIKAIPVNETYHCSVVKRVTDLA